VGPFFGLYVKQLNIYGRYIAIGGGLPYDDFKIL